MLTKNNELSVTNQGSPKSHLDNLLSPQPYKSHISFEDAYESEQDEMLLRMVQRASRQEAPLVVPKESTRTGNKTEGLI